MISIWSTVTGKRKDPNLYPAKRPSQLTKLEEERPKDLQDYTECF